MYRRGELGTLEDGAMVAGVSRRRIMAWLVAAGIDWKQRHAHFLAKHRRRALDRHEGKPTPRRLTKRQLRARATKAKAEWDSRRR